jgi:hypothetical protein
MSFVAASADADLWLALGVVIVFGAGLGIHTIVADRRRSGADPDDPIAGEAPAIPEPPAVDPRR